MEFFKTLSKKGIFFSKSFCDEQFEMPFVKITEPLSHLIITNLSKQTLDFQMVGQSFHRPSVPRYYIEDYRILKLQSRPPFKKL